MSDSKYANPYDEPVVNNLDFVILGATEIDLNFNVNVTTDSYVNIMGGSGGHYVTVYGDCKGFV
jgi:citrate lyase subunit alpha/citrate CoA-transferase